LKLIFHLPFSLFLLTFLSMQSPKQMPKAVYFISDAHLGSETEEKEKIKEKKLIDFLENIIPDAEALYILGDLFEFWFEYKNVIPKEHFNVLIQLKKLIDSGIKIYYITGNHDFWLGDFLPKKIGIRICKEPFWVSHQGKEIYLTHGDGLAKKDRGYRILKRILRNKINIFLYRQIPSDIGVPSAKKVARLSRSHTSQKEKPLEDYINFAKDKISEGFDAVIMGHIHQPTLKDFKSGIYLNTGDWFEHFSYGKLVEGKFLLETYES
jgi:UDP-2,3-diacylglucosamine hydrolase